MVFARLYFFIQAARRSVVAIRLSDQAIRAARPLFSLFRDRPPARRRRQGWRRNRTSACVSWPNSVICSVELTTRGGNLPLETVRPSAVFGRAASVMCPVAVSTLAQREPMASKKLSDVAVSAVSPLLFARRHRPLEPTSVTLAKKLSEALRRLRRRCVAPRRPSPSRRNETDARTLSQ